MVIYDAIAHTFIVPHLSCYFRFGRLSGLQAKTKALVRGPSAFIVLECLGILMKHEARVYEMASQKGLIY